MRTLNSKLMNEKGIALAMVLVISVILLAIMAGLIYMITSGSQVSGFQKRYTTALEAGMGGADFMYRFIGAGGNTALLPPNVPGFTSSINTATNCPYIKLTQLTQNWQAYGCDDSLFITPPPPNNGTYDMIITLGANPSPTYTAYAKIVDTIVVGNTDSGQISGGIAGSLISGGQVVTGGVGGGGNGSGGVTIPYVYAIEIDAENAANPAERAKLSIIYEH